MCGNSHMLGWPFRSCSEDESFPCLRVLLLLEKKNWTQTHMIVSRHCTLVKRPQTQRPVRHPWKPISSEDVAGNARWRGAHFFWAMLAGEVTISSWVFLTQKGWKDAFSSLGIIAARCRWASGAGRDSYVASLAALSECQPGRCVCFCAWVCWLECGGELERSVCLWFCEMWGITAKSSFVCSDRKKEEPQVVWISVCECVCRSHGPVDESHFTAPITGLCSVNVWLVLLLPLFYSLLPLFFFPLKGRPMSLCYSV